MPKKEWIAKFHANPNGLKVKMLKSRKNYEHFVIIKGVTQINERWIMIWTKQQRFISKDKWFLFDFYPIFNVIGHRSDSP